MIKRLLRISGATVVGGIAWLGLRRAWKLASPRNPVVLITGGSRGLGLALAKEFARRGMRIALCSRDLLELRIAEKKLLPYRVEIALFPGDLSDPDQVQELAQNVVRRFGKIDILINNAGIIEVSPFENLTEDDFKNVIDVNLWGMVRTTLKCLPHMPRGSRIVNITSIGGAIAVPHLLPYTISKFGALGFSLGLDAEMGRRGISVTTVLPGLMRTGSFVNALFKGNCEQEFAWFALGSTQPWTSISAETAAGKIANACLRRKHFLTLSAQAKAARLLYQLFPGFALALMRGVNRLLPRPSTNPAQTPELGRLHRGKLGRGGVTRLGDSAGDRLNENIV
jgi:NAD(P)-dependent dehydrogenase (short-subunit alcohol dehydrogenase family)